MFNQFYSEAIVTEEGTVNPNDYDCMEINSRLQADQLDCGDDNVTANLEARETDAKKEAKIGSAAALGGLDRLRGYPQSRFSDSYTNFQGWIVEKGVYTEFRYFYPKFLRIWTKKGRSFLKKDSQKIP